MESGWLTSPRGSPAVAILPQDETDLVVQSSQTEGLIAMRLNNSVETLQTQLEQIKTIVAELRQEYGQKCSVSIGDAIRSLLIVAETVRKADKQIVFWYENGKILKAVLRPLGINKKTSSIVQRKTTKLKYRVASVETKFALTSTLYKEALMEVQTVNRHVNEYTQLGIGAVKDELVGVLVTFEEKKTTIESKIRENEISIDRVNVTIDETNAGIERINIVRDRTSNMRDSERGASALSFGGAIGLGVASLFYPAVGLAAGAAALVGTGQAITASKLDDQVKELERARDELSSQLSGLESEIRSLRAQLPALEQEKEGFTRASTSIKDLESRCREMKEAATELSKFLLQDRQQVSYARTRIERVASDLRTVEYMSTRRQITGLLIEVLQDISQVRAAEVETPKALKKAIAMLIQIELQTPKVLRILESGR